MTVSVPDCRWTLKAGRVGQDGFQPATSGSMVISKRKMDKLQFYITGTISAITEKPVVLASLFVFYSFSNLGIDESLQDQEIKTHCTH